MSEKEEKKEFRKKKWIFFLYACGIWFAAFLFQFAMMELVENTIGIHPYVRLGLMIFFLADSSWLMKKAMESEYMRTILD